MTTASDKGAELSNGDARATIDLGVYRLTALKKAAYRVAGRLTVIIGTPADELVPVAFEFPPSTTSETAAESVRHFYQELLDQELREQVAEETAPLRMLILAQAFSKTGLIRHE